MKWQREVNTAWVVMYCTGRNFIHPKLWSTTVFCQHGFDTCDCRRCRKANTVKKCELWLTVLQQVTHKIAEPQKRKKVWNTKKKTFLTLSCTSGFIINELPTVSSFTRADSFTCQSLSFALPLHKWNRLTRWNQVIKASLSAGESALLTFLSVKSCLNLGQ